MKIEMSDFVAPLRKLPTTTIEMSNIVAHLQAKDLGLQQTYTKMMRTLHKLATKAGTTSNTEDDEHLSQPAEYRPLYLSLIHI